MTAEANRNPEVDSSAELRADIERYFSDELCNVTVSHHDRTFLFTKTQWQVYTPKAIPSQAIEVLLGDYTVRGGSVVIELSRAQIIRKRFGEQCVISDSVQCSLVDYPYSGGPGEKVVFTYYADLQTPNVPYVELFARFLQACLEHSTPSVTYD